MNVNLVDFEKSKMLQNASFLAIAADGTAENEPTKVAVGCNIERF